MKNVSKDYLTHLKIDYNVDKLILESELIDFKPLRIKSKKAKGTPFENFPSWEFGHMKKPFGDIAKVTQYFESLFDVDIDPRYLKQHANTEVPMHSDNGTQTCINILLSDNFGPITFEDIGDIQYECALINVSKRHAVKKHSEERLLLKLSIFDKTYEECYNRLPASIIDAT
tara:strand:- start:1412 stop:1927 length:516 start_codon:yes stop_codon:yes gene_type:complete